MGRRHAPHRLGPGEPSVSESVGAHIPHLFLHMPVAQRQIVGIAVSRPDSLHGIVNLPCIPMPQPSPHGRAAAPSRQAKRALNLCSRISTLIGNSPYQRSGRGYLARHCGMPEGAENEVHPARFSDATMMPPDPGSGLPAKHHAQDPGFLPEYTGSNWRRTCAASILEATL